MDVFLEVLGNSGGETRRVECKGPAVKEELLGGIAKAALGFANHRDGGRILVGATQLPDGTITPTGLSEEEFDSFNIMQFAGEVSSYGSPPIRVDCGPVRHDDKLFIGIKILPFSGDITFCRRSTKSREPIAGTIYVRSESIIESRPARTEEIAALAEMAVEFRLKAQIEKLVRAGVLIVAPELHQDIFDASESYRAERGDF